MENYSVIDFRFARNSDEYNMKYNQLGAWSRIYEYEYVTNFILRNNISNPIIHNSSWGFEGIHVKFRDELDLIGDCLHTDIVTSKYRDTTYYDITKIHEEWINKFNYVLNISTIEHLSSKVDRINAINNLFNQVKCGGYLVLSFDYPRVDLGEIESLVGVKCSDFNDRLNGSNSINPNNKYNDLNIVYLILKKEK